MNVGYKVAQKLCSKKELPTYEYNIYSHIIRANSCGWNEEKESALFHKPVDKDAIITAMHP